MSNQLKEEKIVLTGFMQSGQTIKCGHCEPDKYAVVSSIKCECICHLPTVDRPDLYDYAKGMVKKICSCGMPQSFPIPHEHDRTEREQEIIEGMIHPSDLTRFVDEKLKEQGEKIESEVKRIMLLYKNADFSLDEEIARHIIKVIKEVCNKK